MKAASLLASIALCLAALPAAAAEDLSRPGALDRLKAEKPAHYATVIEIAHAGERQSCGSEDFEAIKARFPLERMECGFLNMSSNPPRRRMTFTIEGVAYALTVRIADTAPETVNRKIDTPR